MKMAPDLSIKKLLADLIIQEFVPPRKLPKLCLRIKPSEVQMVDELKSEEEEEEDEEIFRSDEVVRDLSLKYKETAPALSCHSCGEEIDGEEFVNEEKLYCSEECMGRETQSALPVESTRRRVSLFFLIFSSYLCYSMIAHWM